MRARAWFGVFGLLGLILFGGLALSANGPNGPGDEGGVEDSSTVPPKPTRGGKVVYGIESDPNGLDPSKNGWDPAALLVANAIFDPLVAFDADGKPQPYLLEGETHTPDFTVWTAKVRPNITFHDGSPLTADVIVRHTEAIQKSAITGPAATIVDHAEAVDALTVKLVLKRSWASFPVLLGGQAGTIASPKQLDDPDGSIHPIGTGPFKLQSWDIGKKVSLVRNDNYWRNGLPYLDAVEFQTIGDAQQRLDLLEDGTLNVIHNSDISMGAKIDELAKPPDPKAKGAKGKRPAINVSHDQGITEANFIMLNTAKPPLDDVRVRQALAYGFNRDVLAESMGWPKDRLITDSLFPSGSAWYAATKYPAFDLPKAIQLVKDYEAEKGPIELKLGAPLDPLYQKASQEIAEQWKQIGVDVTLENIDQKQFIIKAVIGQYDAVLFRYFGAADPDNNFPFWTSDTLRPIGQISLNFTRLSDPAIDQALIDGQATNDLGERRKAYAKIQERFAELVPYIWTYRTDWAIASNKSVHDVMNKTLPDGKPALPFVAGVHRLTETWIEKN